MKYEATQKVLGLRAVDFLRRVWIPAMESNLPRVVDFMITGICNWSCPFCYGPDPNDRSGLSLHDCITMFDFLSKAGIEGVVIAGGEPTLSPILGEALTEFSHRKMWAALQTNGTRPRVLIPYLELLAWLALPLDSVSVKASKALRTSRDHPRITLSFVRRSEVSAARSTGMGLKIGTVLTQHNVQELPEIARMVAEINPDIWKIYQLRPRGAGRFNASTLELPDEEFSEATSQVVHMVPDVQVLISPAKHSVRAYIIINPDSTILIPRYDRYLSFGRLVTLDGSIDDAVWRSAVSELDIAAHVTNTADSFPGNQPYSTYLPNVRSASEMKRQSILSVTPMEVFDRDGV
jgi:radical S-adenosyl methionine domain-containing protein 2